MVSSLTENKNFRVRTESLNTKMIVIADPDIIRNDVRRVGLNETTAATGSG